MNPRFAIINTCDAPQRRMVCEYLDGVGYCYMARAMEPHLKMYDGMNPERPTSLEDFGFDIEISNNEALFRRTRTWVATYEDGMPRKWQDRVYPFEFSLPLVDKKSIKRRRVKSTEAR